MEYWVVQNLMETKLINQEIYSKEGLQDDDKWN